MGKKTIVPVKSRGYKVVSDYLEYDTKLASQTITFPGKVAVILYRVVLSNNNGTSTMGGVFNYKYDKDRSFFDPFINTIIDNLPSSNPTSYYTGTSYGITCTKDSDDTYTFKTTGSAIRINNLTYLAILEDNLEDEIRPIFLTNGTIVHTDGEITPEVADSVQTIETNKYKIKANTLVNISNATYINLSN